jgi:hypothetical protein
MGSIIFISLCLWCVVFLTTNFYVMRDCRLTDATSSLVFPDSACRGRQAFAPPVAWSAANSREWCEIVKSMGL